MRYSPGEAAESLKGGNSNWRGPVWFPTTFLMIESLRKLRKAYGGAFAIPSPVDSEGIVTPDDIARGFANRLISLFTRDASGRRPAIAISTAAPAYTSATEPKVRATPVATPAIRRLRFSTHPITTLQAVSWSASLARAGTSADCAGRVAAMAVAPTTAAT